MASLVQDQIGAMQLVERRNDLATRLKVCPETERPMLQVQVDFLSGLIEAMGRNITRAKEWMK